MIHAGGASSSASANDSPARTAPALSPREEEEEYQKICEHDEQLMTNGSGLQAHEKSAARNKRES